MSRLSHSLICLLVLYTVLSSCDNGQTKAKTSSGQVEPINPNGDSELALLMREMYYEMEDLKKGLTKEQSVKIEVDHQAIITAHGTEPEKVASKEYKAFAKSYLSAIDQLKTAQPGDAQAAFSSVVSNCMSCHQAMCPGPIVRIKKLM